MSSNDMNEGSIWQQKQEWLERVMASKLTHAQTRYAFCIFKRMYGDKVESWPTSENIMEDGGFASTGHFKDFRDALIASGALVAELGYHTTGAQQKNYKYTLNLDWDGAAAPRGIAVAPQGGGRSTSGDGDSTSGAGNTPSNTSKSKTVNKKTSTTASAVLEARNEGEVVSQSSLSGESSASPIVPLLKEEAAPVEDDGFNTDIKQHNIYWARFRAERGSLTPFDFKRKMAEEAEVYQKHNRQKASSGW